MMLFFVIGQVLGLVIWCGILTLFVQLNKRLRDRTQAFENKYER